MADSTGTHICLHVIGRANNFEPFPLPPLRFLSLLFMFLSVHIKVNDTPRPPSFTGCGNPSWQISHDGAPGQTMWPNRLPGRCMIWRRDQARTISQIIKRSSGESLERRCDFCDWGSHSVGVLASISASVSESESESTCGCASVSACFC